MIKVVIVDDHDLVRAGFRRILTEHDGVQVCGEAATGEQALEMVRTLTPDVVLLDVNMPGIGGLATTSKLRQVSPGTRIIIVTVYVEEPYPKLLLEAGASGYITKSSAVAELIEAIRCVAAGKTYLGREIAQQMALARLPQGESSPFDQLSPRELQVLLMVSRGDGIQEISDQLCLSPKTVSTYRYRLFDKLKVDNDVQLTRLALRHGLIELQQGEAGGLESGL